MVNIHRTIIKNIITSPATKEIKLNNYKNKGMQMEKKKQSKAIEELKEPLKEPIKEGEQDSKQIHDKKVDPKDAKIKELEESNKELVDTLQHLQAEFENYNKRACKDNEHMIRFASAKLIERLLPILDSFELALKSEKNDEQFRKGVELIYTQLFSTLESEGLRPIKCMGEKFSPYWHEVMLKVPSDKNEDVIIEEMQKGYMLNDKVMRHSKVKVSKGKQDNK